MIPFFVKENAYFRKNKGVVSLVTVLTNIMEKEKYMLRERADLICMDRENVLKEIELYRRQEC